MGNDTHEFERLVLGATTPVFVSIAADDVLLGQNADLRSCLEGRLVVRRPVEIDDGESEFVSFYLLPADIEGRRVVLKWFWSAEQLRLMACCSSQAVLERLPEKLMRELASASDRTISRTELAQGLEECEWAVFLDHSDGADELCVIDSQPRLK